MKVLMIEHFLPGSPYSAELSEKLSKYVDLTLFTSRHYQKKKKNYKCKAILETNISSSKLGILYYGAGVIYTAAACLLGKYDIVHVQTFKSMRTEMPIYKLMKRCTGKKLIYTAHNILPHENNEAEAKLLKEWYPMCDKIVVHNEQSRRVLCQFINGIDDKICIIPHGTYSFYENCVKEEKHDKKVFLQLGMIRKYKGIEQLIRAVGLLPQSVREQIKIVIAGKQYKKLDATDYEGLISSLGVKDCIEFVPKHIPDEEIPQYFNGCDFCLFPYEEIYGSGALLLAYTFNKPVIISDIPSFIEETNNQATGLAFEAGNVQDLADKIQKMLKATEKEVLEYKKNIVYLKDSKYNWEISAKILTEMYEGAYEK